MKISELKKRVEERRKTDSSTNNHEPVSNNITISIPQDLDPKHKSFLEQQQRELEEIFRLKQELDRMEEE